MHAAVFDRIDDGLLYFQNQAGKIFIGRIDEIADAKDDVVDIYRQAKNDAPQYRLVGNSLIM